MLEVEFGFGLFYIYTLVTEYCWQPAKKKKKVVPSVVSFLSSVLLRCHLVTWTPYSTSKFRGFFLGSCSACDLPKTQTACRAAEEIPGLSESDRAIAVLPLQRIRSLFFPRCALRGGGREVVWFEVFFWLGLVVYLFCGCQSM